MLNAWLQVTAEPDQMTRHFDRVPELAKTQNNRGLGFLVVSEPPNNRFEQANDLLQKGFAGVAAGQLGVGL